MGEKRARVENARHMRAVETPVARTCDRPELPAALIEATARRER